MSESVLSLKRFGVAFEEKIILSSVNLEIPEKGNFIIMGPAGTGKSTLLRTIAGFNDSNPSMRIWGEALYAGDTLKESNRPALVAQSAKLMLSTIFENMTSVLPERGQLTQMQQRNLIERILVKEELGDLIDGLDKEVVGLPLYLKRLLAILRMSITSPRLLCIDEPTAGLDDSEAHQLLDFIDRKSKQHTVLTVLHNQKHAKKLGGTIALLAGGWVQESGLTKQFFKSPKSEAGKEYIINGNCSIPSPKAKIEDIDPAIKIKAPRIPKAARKSRSAVFGPNGFLWLKRGMLAGTPRPGIIADVHADLEALKQAGITCLVSLTEKPFDTLYLDNYGIKSLWLSIPDMLAPSVEEAVRLCDDIADLMAQGEIVALHCKAGLGRTGTMLACQLIWEGQSALGALDTVRKVQPRWVQSDIQVQFLSEFEIAIHKDEKLQYISRECASRRSLNI